MRNLSSGSRPWENVGSKSVFRPKQKKILPFFRPYTFSHKLGVDSCHDGFFLTPCQPWRLQDPNSVFSEKAKTIPHLTRNRLIPIANFKSLPRNAGFVITWVGRCMRQIQEDEHFALLTATIRRPRNDEAQEISKLVKEVVAEKYGHLFEALPPITDDAAAWMGSWVAEEGIQARETGLPPSLRRAPRALVD
jgi:hypothetical protein